MLGSCAVGAVRLKHSLSRVLWQVLAGLVRQATAMTAVGLAVVYFYSNVLAPPLAQASFWSERQKAVQNLDAARRGGGLGGSGTFALSPASKQQGAHSTAQGRAVAADQLAFALGPSPRPFDHQPATAWPPDLRVLPGSATEAPLVQPLGPPSFTPTSSGSPLVLASAALPGVSPLVPTLTHLGSSLPPLPQLSPGVLARYPVLGSIPFVYGTIKNVHLAPGHKRPLILHLQDVHMNSEAQSHIASLLEGLLANGQIGVVGVEAAHGAFDFKPFRAFPHPALTKDIATYLVSQGELAAVSYVGITAAEDHSASFWGVDSSVHYKAHVEAIKRSKELQPAYLARLNALKVVVAQLKADRLNPELRALEAQVNAYRKGKIGLGAYLEALTSKAVIPEGRQRESRGGSPLTPQLQQFLEVYHHEKALDFSRVEQERKALLTHLLPKLDQTALSQLVAQSVAYRSEQISYAAYYQYLEALCRRHGLPLQRYPAMRAYVQYVLQADRINAEALFHELTEAEDAALATLIQRSEEQQLLTIAKQLALMEQLVKLELTPDQWDAWHPLRTSLTALEHDIQTLTRDGVRHRTSFRGGVRSPRRRFLTESEERLLGTTWESDTSVSFRGGLPYHVLKERPTWESMGVEGDNSVPDPNSSNSLTDLASFEDFYKEAEARDEAMVTNLLARMQTTGASMGVLIAGGFHSPGIARLLKERQISYVSLAPKITKLDTADGTKYLDVFVREKTPLEKLFTGEKLFVQHAGAVPGALGPFIQPTKTVADYGTLQLIGNAYRWLNERLKQASVVDPRLAKRELAKVALAVSLLFGTVGLGSVELKAVDYQGSVQAVDSVTLQLTQATAPGASRRRLQVEGSVKGPPRARHMIARYDVDISREGPQGGEKDTLHVVVSGGASVLRGLDVLTSVSHTFATQAAALFPILQSLTGKGPELFSLAWLDNYGWVNLLVLLTVAVLFIAKSWGRFSFSRPERLASILMAVLLFANLIGVGFSDTDYWAARRVPDPSPSLLPWFKGLALLNVVAAGVLLVIGREDHKPSVLETFLFSHLVAERRGSPIWQDLMLAALVAFLLGNLWMLGSLFGVFTGFLPVAAPMTPLHSDLLVAGFALGGFTSKARTPGGGNVLEAAALELIRMRDFDAGDATITPDGLVDIRTSRIGHSGKKSNMALGRYGVEVVKLRANQKLFIDHYLTGVHMDLQESPDHGVSWNSLRLEYFADQDDLGHVVDSLQRLARSNSQILPGRSGPTTSGFFPEVSLVLPWSVIFLIGISVVLYLAFGVSSWKLTQTWKEGRRLREELKQLLHDPSGAQSEGFALRTLRAPSGQSLVTDLKSRWKDIGTSWQRRLVVFSLLLGLAIFWTLYFGRLYGPSIYRALSSWLAWGSLKPKQPEGPPDYELLAQALHALLVGGVHDVQESPRVPEIQPSERRWLDIWVTGLHSVFSEPPNSSLQVVVKQWVAQFGEDVKMFARSVLQQGQALVIDVIRNQASGVQSANALVTALLVTALTSSRGNVIILEAEEPASVERFQALLETAAEVAERAIRINDPGHGSPPPTNGNGTGRHLSAISGGEFLLPLQAIPLHLSLLLNVSFLVTWFISLGVVLVLWLKRALGTYDPAHSRLGNTFAFALVSLPLLMLLSSLPAIAAPVTPIRSDLLVSWLALGITPQQPRPFTSGDLTPEEEKVLRPIAEHLAFSVFKDLGDTTPRPILSVAYEWRLDGPRVNLLYDYRRDNRVKYQKIRLAAAEAILGKGFMEFFKDAFARKFAQDSQDVKLAGKLVGYELNLSVRPTSVSLFKVVEDHRKGELLFHEGHASRPELSTEAFLGLFAELVRWPYPPGPSKTGGMTKFLGIVLILLAGGAVFSQVITPLAAAMVGVMTTQESRGPNLLVPGMPPEIVREEITAASSPSQPMMIQMSLDRVGPEYAFGRLWGSRWSRVIRILRTWGLVRFLGGLGVVILLGGLGSALAHPLVHPALTSSLDSGLFVSFPWLALGTTQPGDEEKNRGHSGQQRLSSFKELVAAAVDELRDLLLTLSKYDIGVLRLGQEKDPQVTKPGFVKEFYFPQEEGIEDQPVAMVNLRLVSEWLRALGREIVIEGYRVAGSQAWSAKVLERRGIPGENMVPILEAPGFSIAGQWKDSGKATLQQVLLRGLQPGKSQRSGFSQVLVPDGLLLLAVGVGFLLVALVALAMAGGLRLIELRKPIDIGRRKLSRPLDWAKVGLAGLVIVWLLLPTWVLHDYVLAPSLTGSLPSNALVPSLWGLTLPGEESKQHDISLGIAQWSTSLFRLDSELTRLTLEGGRGVTYTTSTSEYTLPHRNTNSATAFIDAHLLPGQTVILPRSREEGKLEVTFPGRKTITVSAPIELSEAVSKESVAPLQQTFLNEWIVSAAVKAIWDLLFESRYGVQQVIIEGGEEGGVKALDAQDRTIPSWKLLRANTFGVQQVAIGVLLKGGVKALDAEDHENTSNEWKTARRILSLLAQVLPYQKRLGLGKEVEVRRNDWGPVPLTITNRWLNDKGSYQDSSTGITSTRVGGTEVTRAQQKQVLADLLSVFIGDEADPRSKSPPDDSSPPAGNRADDRPLSGFFSGPFLATQGVPVWVAVVWAAATFALLLFLEKLQSRVSVSWQWKVLRTLGLLLTALWCIWTICTFVLVTRPLLSLYGPSLFHAFPSWLALGTQKPHNSNDEVDPRLVTIRPLREPIKAHPPGLTVIAYDPAGEFLASGGYNGPVNVWDMVTGGLAARLPGQFLGVTALTFAPDGKAVGMGSKEGASRLWRWPLTAMGATKFRDRQWRTIHGVAFHPDGRFLASAKGHQVDLWDVATEQQFWRFDGSQETIFSVAFTRDGGKIFAGDAEGTIRGWDVGAAQVLKGRTGNSHAVSLFHGHAGPVGSLDVSHDGRFLASGSWDGTIRLWFAANGQPVRILTGHSGWVEVAFSHDGQRLVSGGGDGTLCLWEVSTGQLLGTREQAHPLGVSKVAYHPRNASEFASAGLDGSVQRWEITSGKPVPAVTKRPLETHARAGASALLNAPFLEYFLGTPLSLFLGATFLVVFIKLIELMFEGGHPDYRRFNSEWPVLIAAIAAFVAALVFLGLFLLFAPLGLEGVLSLRTPEGKRQALAEAQLNQWYMDATRAVQTFFPLLSGPDYLLLLQIGNKSHSDTDVAELSLKDEQVSARQTLQAFVRTLAPEEPFAYVWRRGRNAVFQPLFLVFVFWRNFSEREKLSLAIRGLHEVTPPLTANLGDQGSVRLMVEAIGQIRRPDDLTAHEAAVQRLMDTLPSVFLLIGIGLAVMSSITQLTHLIPLAGTLRDGPVRLRHRETRWITNAARALLLHLSRLTIVRDLRGQLSLEQKTLTSTYVAPDGQRPWGEWDSNPSYSDLLKGYRKYLAGKQLVFTATKGRGQIEVSVRQTNVNPNGEAHLLDSLELRKAFRMELSQKSLEALLIRFREGVLAERSLLQGVRLANRRYQSSIDQLFTKLLQLPRRRNGKTLVQDQRAHFERETAKLAKQLERAAKDLWRNFHISWLIAAVLIGVGGISALVVGFPTGWPVLGMAHQHGMSEAEKRKHVEDRFTDLYTRTEAAIRTLVNRLQDGEITVDGERVLSSAIQEMDSPTANALEVIQEFVRTFIRRIIQRGGGALDFHESRPGQFTITKRAEAGHEPLHFSLSVKVAGEVYDAQTKGFKYREESFQVERGKPYTRHLALREIGRLYRPDGKGQTLHEEAVVGALKTLGMILLVLSLSVLLPVLSQAGVVLPSLVALSVKQRPPEGGAAPASQRMTLPQAVGFTTDPTEFKFTVEWLAKAQSAKPLLPVEKGADANEEKAILSASQIEPLPLVARNAETNDFCLIFYPRWKNPIDWGRLSGEETSMIPIDVYVVSRQGKIKWLTIPIKEGTPSYRSELDRRLQAKKIHLATVRNFRRGEVRYVLPQEKEAPEYQAMSLKGRLSHAFKMLLPGDQLMVNSNTIAKVGGVEAVLAIGKDEGIVLLEGVEGPDGHFMKRVTYRPSGGPSLGKSPEKSSGSQHQLSVIPWFDTVPLSLQAFQLNPSFAAVLFLANAATILFLLVSTVQRSWVDRFRFLTFFTVGLVMGAFTLAEGWGPLPFLLNEKPFHPPNTLAQDEPTIFASIAEALFGQLQPLYLHTATDYKPQPGDSVSVLQSGDVVYHDGHNGRNFLLYNPTLRDFARAYLKRGEALVSQVKAIQRALEPDELPFITAIRRALEPDELQLTLLREQAGRPKREVLFPLSIALLFTTDKEKIAKLEEYVAEILARRDGTIQVGPWEIGHFPRRLVPRIKRTVKIAGIALTIFAALMGFLFSLYGPRLFHAFPSWLALGIKRSQKSGGPQLHAQDPEPALDAVSQVLPSYFSYAKIELVSGNPASEVQHIRVVSPWGPDKDLRFNMRDLPRVGLAGARSQGTAHAIVQLMRRAGIRRVTVDSWDTVTVVKYGSRPGTDGSPEVLDRHKDNEAQALYLSPFGQYVGPQEAVSAERAISRGELDRFADSDIFTLRLPDGSSIDIGLSHQGRDPEGPLASELFRYAVQRGVVPHPGYTVPSDYLLLVVAAVLIGGAAALAVLPWAIALSTDQTGDPSGTVGRTGQSEDAVKAAEPKRVILIVDDTPGKLKVIERSVKEGIWDRKINPVYQIKTAESGAEALQVVRELQTTGRLEEFLLITDYDMPEMTGDRLVKKLRATYPSLGIRVIVVTSSPDEATTSFYQTITGDTAVFPKTQKAWEVVLEKAHNILEKKHDIKILSYSDVGSSKFVKSVTRWLKLPPSKGDRSTEGPGGAPILIPGLGLGWGMSLWHLPTMVWLWLGMAVMFFAQTVSAGLVTLSGQFQRNLTRPDPAGQGPHERSAVGNLLLPEMFPIGAGTPERRRALEGEADQLARGIVQVVLEGQPVEALGMGMEQLQGVPGVPLRDQLARAVESVRPDQLGQAGPLIDGVVTLSRSAHAQGVRALLEALGRNPRDPAGLVETLLKLAFQDIALGITTREQFLKVLKDELAHSRETQDTFARGLLQVMQSHPEGLSGVLCGEFEAIQQAQEALVWGVQGQPTMEPVNRTLPHLVNMEEAVVALPPSMPATAFELVMRDLQGIEAVLQGQTLQGQKLSEEKRLVLAERKTGGLVIYSRSREFRKGQEATMRQAFAEQFAKRLEALHRTNAPPPGITQQAIQILVERNRFAPLAAASPLTRDAVESLLGAKQPAGLLAIGDLRGWTHQTLDAVLQPRSSRKQIGTVLFDRRSQRFLYNVPLGVLQFLLQRQETIRQALAQYA